jgi:arsenate reductase-like glutaredoxin family protein
MAPNDDSSKIIHHNKLAAIRAEIAASGLSPEICDLMQTKIDDADLIYSLSQIEAPSAEEIVQNVRTIARLLSDKISTDVRQEVRAQAKLRSTIIEAVQSSVPGSIMEAFANLTECPVHDRRRACTWRDTVKAAVGKSPIAIALIIVALALSGQLHEIAKMFGLSQ